MYIPSGYNASSLFNLMTGNNVNGELSIVFSDGESSCTLTGDDAISVTISSSLTNDRAYGVGNFPSKQANMVLLSDSLNRVISTMGGYINMPISISFQIASGVSIPMGVFYANPSDVISTEGISCTLTAYDSAYYLTGNYEPSIDEWPVRPAELINNILIEHGDITLAADAFNGLDATLLNTRFCLDPTIATEYYTSSLEDCTDTFTGNGSRTTFTLSHIPFAITSCTVGGDVVSDYTVDEDSIVFATAPASGSAIVVVYTYMYGGNPAYTYKKITYRQAIAHVAFLMGCNAVFNRENKLKFIPFIPNSSGRTSQMSITPDHYAALSFSKTSNTKSYIGVLGALYQYVDASGHQQIGENFYTSGSEYSNTLTINTLDISTSSLTNVYGSAILGANGIDYQGYNLSMLYGFPYLDWGDAFTLTDYNGDTYAGLPILSVTHTYNGAFSTSMNAEPFKDEDVEATYGASYKSDMSALSANVDAANSKALTARILAEAAGDTASRAMASANGKNTIYRQPTQPAGGNYVAGDTWFDSDDDNKIYRYDGTMWVAVTLGDDAIGNLNASHINAGTIDASQVTVSNLDAGNITTGNLSADRMKVNSISAINSNTGSVKIQANKVEIDGTAVFNAIENQVDSAIDEAVDDIEVGGRNLVPKSQNVKSFTVESSYLGVTYTPTSCTAVNNSSNQAVYGLYYDINVESGEKYILSATFSNVSGTAKWAIGDKTDGTSRSEWTGITGYAAITNGLNTKAFSIPSDCNKIRIYIATQENGSRYTISNLKLEKGTKATDWTPALDDVRSTHTVTAQGVDASYPYENILTFSEQLNSIWDIGDNTGINVGDTVRVKVIASNMGTSGTPVYVVGTVTYVNPNGSHIKIDGHGLDTTVIDGGHILTGTIDANKVNISTLNVSSSSGWSGLMNSNIEIGGRNLCKNTGFNDLSMWYGSPSVSDGKLTITTATEVGLSNDYKTTFTIPAGASYTVSCYFYENTIADGNRRIYFRDQPAWDYWTVPANFTGLFSRTSTASQDITRLTVEYDTRGATSGKWVVGPVKIELGNKATDWTPAPEDMKSIHTLMAPGGESASSATYAQIIGWCKEGTTQNWNVTSTAGVKKGDTVRVGYYVSNMGTAGNRPVVYCVGTVIDVLNSAQLSMTMHGLDTTIIDGGNIITDSITANQIAANAITASELNTDDINNSGLLSTGALTVGAQNSVLNSKIQIGGVNLIPLSRNLKSFTIENVNYGSVTFTNVDCYLAVTTPNTSRYGLYYDVSVSASTTYTLSYKASSVTGTVSLGVGNRTGSNTGWSDIVAYTNLANGTNVTTFTTPSGVTKIRIYFGGTNGSHCYIWKLKLELGNKVSDWTSAPEDTASVKYLTSAYSNPYSTYVRWVADYASDTYSVTSSSGVNVGDVVLIEVACTTTNKNMYIQGRVTAIPNDTQVTISPMGLVDKADYASKNATSYITHIDNDGIRVHPFSTENNSVVINASGMEVFKGGTAAANSVAFYGDTARVGKSNASRVEISTAGMDIYGKNDYGTWHCGTIGIGSTNTGSGTDYNPYYTFGYRSGTIGAFSATVGATPQATGYSCFAQGQGKAGGYNAAAVNAGTASGDYSFACGVSTASADDSFASGSNCTASHACSAVFGSFTKTSAANQVVIGKSNANDANALFIVGKGSSSNAFTVSTSGNVAVNGTTVHSSDRRLKEHIAYIGDEAVEFIDGLKPAHFIKEGEKHIGFYAQDVEKIDKWDCMTGEMNGYMTLGYMELLAPMVAYIQRLEKRIEELERSK